jgi:gamma-glutamylcyclotransferase (GGCT)/AIG2-like uncharacterized protein YtfP
MHRRLPVFVYGTLRRHQRNYRSLLEGFTTAEYDTRLARHRLYDSGLPYVAECDDSSATVVGDLMIAATAEYDELLARLDLLEGVEYGHYARLARPVTFRTRAAGAWETTVAWVYQGGQGFDYDDRWLVPGGDWLHASTPPR